MELIIFILILILIPIFAISYLVSSLLKKETKYTKSKTYQYTKRQYLLTKPEHEFFNTLVTLLNNQYYVFPQIHLASLLNHKIPGQSWSGARSHIDRKSLDYVICDKTYLSPLLAIEFDDSSHSRDDRIERDNVVNTILENTKMPLLRVPYTEAKNTEKLRNDIFQILKGKKEVQV